jgi:hypothetical protein
MLIFLTDNGGPPGVLYEFLVASFYYCFIAASLAEVCFRSYTKSLRVLIHFSRWFRPFPPQEVSIIGLL